jgi:hypothetical protein
MKLLKKLFIPLVILISFDANINPSISKEIPLNCASNHNTSGKTRRELGKNYQQYLLNAKKNILLLPVNMSVKFPLGVICPLRIGDTLENPNTEQPNPKLEVIGFIEQATGKTEIITPADLAKMFDKSLAATNQRDSTLSPMSQNLSTDNNTGTFSQTQNMAVIDLIAIDTRSKQAYLIPDILFISFFRDAFNAAVNKQVVPNNYDLKHLNLSHPSDQPEQLPQSIPEDLPMTLDNVNYAVNKLSSMSMNKNIRIPTSDGRYFILGSINPNSRVSEPIKVRDLIAMFKSHIREGGEINPGITIQQNNLSRNGVDSQREHTRNSPTSEQEVFVIDLIIRDTSDSHTYLVRGVNFNALKRDAFNAVLNNTLIAD